MKSNKTFRVVLGILAVWFLIPGGAVLNANAKEVIDIQQPQEGTTLSAEEPIELKYEVNTSPDGDHIHISVDGQKPDIVKDLSGVHEIGPLPPGEHTIQIVEVTKDHRPTGNEESIDVVVR